jgi:protoporphyrinogen oxidase
MKRRDFIRLSSLALLPILACNDSRKGALPFDITVESDRKTGHLVLKSLTFSSGQNLETETMIVGGGIAGMSAAFQLRHKDFLLFEAGKQLGGSSGSLKLNGSYFSQGAHYDLAYPDAYGKEVIEMMQDLQIISFNSVKNQWEFIDKQHIIPHEKEGSCFVDGFYRDDVLPDRPETYNFLQLLRQYEGKMPLPTRLISDKLRHLNNISFKDFLQQNKIYLSKQLLRGLDYHMIDDYGATTEKVSALAGIHYYKCRPYYDENPPELFSPPEGNYYFINKIARQLPAENLKTRHLVRSIEKEKDYFIAKVIDAEKEVVYTVKCKQVVYAGQKHALPYVFPQDKNLFASNTYAPWLVMNFILKNDLPEGVWQNEMLMKDRRFLGFVDSDAQHQQKNAPRVLTAYYCFAPEERQLMADIEEKKQAIVEQTVGYISDYFQQDIFTSIEKVFIKLMGHAMPIAKPGYLFDDKNQYRSEQHLVYAGVDNARLPVLFEALDSGIAAVAELKINS